MNKKIFFLTIAYPPNPTAASVVHTHLLNQFDHKQFVILKGWFPGARKVDIPKGKISFPIYVSFEFISTKVHRIAAFIQKFTIPLLLFFYYLRYKPKLFIIAYPDLYWLDICTAFAVKHNISFIPYLHDTLVEGVYNPKKKELAQKVQERIFKNSRSIAVMSEGMQALYKRKYGIETTSWEHIYEENPNEYKIPEFNRIHWSGDVYEINYQSVKRVSEAIVGLGLDFTISNGKSREQLGTLGLDTKIFEKVFYKERKDYLKHLNQSKIVLLGLNYPEECQVHVDELSTIFSTKTPEYLASNAIIIYNGPKEYFLAQFLIKNSCGLVIDSKNVVEIREKILEVIKNYESYVYLSSNAKKAMALFHPNTVKQKVEYLINE